jgi:hypothetical protein
VGGACVGCAGLDRADPITELAERAKNTTLFAAAAFAPRFLLPRSHPTPAHLIMTATTSDAAAPAPAPVAPEPGQSPASAAFAARGVCRPLADAAAALGWSKPTEIQAQAVPYALKGERRRR